jgi:hypothetical protein
MTRHPASRHGKLDETFRIFSTFSRTRFVARKRCTYLVIWSRSRGCYCFFRPVSSGSECFMIFTCQPSRKIILLNVTPCMPVACWATYALAMFFRTLVKIRTSVVRPMHAICNNTNNTKVIHLFVQYWTYWKWVQLFR